MFKPEVERGLKALREYTDAGEEEQNVEQLTQAILDLVHQANLPESASHALCRALGRQLMEGAAKGNSFRALEGAKIAYQAILATALLTVEAHFRGREETSGNQGPARA